MKSSLKSPSLFFIILSAALIYRLLNFDYPLLNSEAHRDYLIARHIAQYREFIQTGPCCLWNGAFGNYRKAPIYYYSLAILTLLFDNIYFLTLVNLLLQAIPLVVIYLIASHLFSQKAALVSVLLFSFNQETFKAALFIWEPHLMQPFLYLSYLALFYAYLKKNLKLLAAALLLFIFAGSLHSSAYAITPTFLLLAFLILKSQQVNKTTYLILLCLTITYTTLLHLPLILFTIKHYPSLDLHTNFLVETGTAYFDNFQTFAVLLIKSFYFTSEKPLPVLSQSLALLSLFLVLTYLKTLSFQNQKKFFLFIPFSIIQLLALASLFKAQAQHFYLLPIFGAFIIFLAVSLTEQTSPLLKSASLIWLALMLYSFSIFYPLKITAFSHQRQINPAIQAIIGKIKQIQTKNGYQTANFFQVEVFAPGSESPTNDSLSFYIPLEKMLQTRMFNLVNTSQGYHITNSDDYIFIVCHSLLKPIDLFSACLSTPTFMEEIYRSQAFIIYLKKKI